MTSVILNRRTLLSGGTLLGLGALLAACGQQAANEASASAAPSETASATPSEMTSASASTPSSGALGFGTFCAGPYLSAGRYSPSGAFDPPE